MKNKINYAVREIILVVVGILIAVSINNWNENRKDNLRLTNILKMVKNDMIRDTLYTHEVIKFYNFQDSLAQIVIQDTTTIKYFKTNTKALQIPFNNVPFKVTSSAIEFLKRHSYEMDIVTDSTIVNILQFHSHYQAAFEDMDEKIKHDVKNNTDHLKSHGNHLSLKQKKNKSDAYLNYFLTDDYKDRVLMHQKLTSRNSVFLMNQFNQRSAAFIALIDAKLEEL